MRRLRGRANAASDPQRHRAHLKPLLGHLAVNKLTTLDIDDLYRHLFAPAVLKVGRSRRAPFIGCTSCCIGR